MTTWSDIPEVDDATAVAMLRQGKMSPLKLCPACDLLTRGVSCPVCNGPVVAADE